MALCCHWQVSGLLEQTPKLRLGSETHGSICHGLARLDGVCGKIDSFTGFLRTGPGVFGVGRLARGAGFGRMCGAPRCLGHSDLLGGQPQPDRATDRIRHDFEHLSGGQVPRYACELGLVEGPGHRCPGKLNIISWSGVRRSSREPRLSGDELGRNVREPLSTPRGPYRGRPSHAVRRGTMRLCGVLVMLGSSRVSFLRHFCSIAMIAARFGRGQQGNVARHGRVSYGC